jgi:hypothetical protein
MTHGSDPGISLPDAVIDCLSKNLPSPAARGKPMSDLLSSVLAAHGGLERWQKLKTGAAMVHSSGKLLDMKAQGGIPLRFTVSLHEQAVSIAPIGADWRSSFTPNRVVIEKTTGEVIAERTNPRESFRDHDLNTKWDPLDRTYFGAYATWNYLNAPFMFMIPGVQTEEISRLEQNGESWRGLQVTLPDGLASHSRVQKFYFGEDFLLRRLDYTLDIAGRPNIAHYVYDHARFDGLVVPTKRRAYLCDDRYRVLYDQLLIALDLSEIEYR